MRSMLRRSRCLIVAGAVVALAMGAVPWLTGRALAIGPVIPYLDNDQASDQPPSAWLLMAPPTTHSGLSVDTQGGLARWIVYGRYNTLKECSTTIQFVRNGDIPNSGLPAQMTGGAIPLDAVPGGSAQAGMQPGYGGMQPGYGGMQPGYGGMQPGYGGMQPGYGGMRPGYPGAQPGYPPMQPGAAMGQSGYPGMSPGAQGMPPGYQGMPPGSQAMQPGYQVTPGYSGMPSGYASNQPMIQQPAQLMTRQQAAAAYCFADNDRRLQGLINPPPGLPLSQPSAGAGSGLGQGYPGVQR
ncbi:MAG TPA: hypothetical protein VMV15_07600 [Candidatus Binataceae bacterium]|nr:hypothetical protein [Candidatus Binataceae bacterium]